MNKEIKFRIWSKRDNQYWLSADLDEINLSNGVINLSNNFRYQCGENNSDNFILQQFTGLFDKNRKEIYEGDIVKTVSNGDEGFHEELLGEVTFYWGCFCVGKYKEKIKNKFRETKLAKKGNNLLFYFDKLEVLGNIFENPKLLS